MGPSLSQLKLLSPEDRILYKKWLRRSLLIYSSIAMFLVFLVVADRILSAESPDMAGDEMHTAAVSARK
jgi:hypothetical protein